MDYKELYKQIPKGYKGEVAGMFPNSQSNVITKWLKGDVSKDRKLKINAKVLEVWEAHSLAGTLLVELSGDIIVNNMTEISYDELMKFRIDELQLDTHSYATEIKSMLENADKIFNDMSKDSPYALNYLIAKYLINAKN